jgi:hypothetical protein
MAITKQITNAQGVVYEHHKITSVIIDAQDGMFATVLSWISKDREADRPVDRFSTQIHTSITTGLVATAETLLVSDPNCKLFGGVVTPDVTQTDLDKAKAKKKAEIAAARNVEMYADKVTSLGTFGSTESDNNKLSIAIQVTQLAAAAGQPAECGYKDVNGVYSVYTLAQLEQIALEIAAQVIPLYEREAILLVSVEAATTVEEVESINFGVLP